MNGHERKQKPWEIPRNEFKYVEWWREIKEETMSFIGIDQRNTHRPHYYLTGLYSCVSRFSLFALIHLLLVVFNMMLHRFRWYASEVCCVYVVSIFLMSLFLVRFSVWFIDKIRLARWSKLTSFAIFIAFVQMVQKKACVLQGLNLFMERVDVSCFKLQSICRTLFQ